MAHSSPIPIEPQAAVFRAVCDSLKRHPLLAGRVKSWRVRDGSTTDDDSPAEGNLPWVRLTPVGLPQERDTRVTIACPIQVDVEIATRRADRDFMLDLAGRIHSALFRWDHAGTRNLWAAMRAAGGSEIVPGQAFLPSTAEDFGPGIVNGRGNFRVNIYVKTR